MSEIIAKNKDKKLIIILSIVIFAIIGTLLLIFTQAATANATFTLTPSSSTVNNGSNFTVAIKENSLTQSVFSLGVELNYDSTKLNFVSVNNTGSPFTTCQELTGATVGKVKITCYISPSATPNSVTGEQLVANVTFQAKVGSGSTALTFSPKSDTLGVFENTNAENIWTGTTTGGTYTLATPDTTPPTVSITAPANASTVSGTTTAINATASDNSGTVSKVEFLVNGVLKSTDTTSPYSYTWDTTTIVDGTYPIVVKAYDGVSPTPNSAQATVNVTVQNNKPDLTVTSITLNPATPNTGTVTSISAVIKNNGTAAISAGTSRSVVATVDSTALSTITDTQAIAVGASVTVTFPTNWTATKGAHNIIVSPDKNNQIVELNETNNDATKAITVYTLGDVDNNGTINIADLNPILLNWGKTGQTRTNGDLTGDGIINISDLNQVLLKWTR